MTQNSLQIARPHDHSLLRASSSSGPSIYPVKWVWLGKMGMAKQNDLSNLTKAILLIFAAIELVELPPNKNSVPITESHRQKFSL